jgi:hypothetical protein
MEVKVDLIASSSGGMRVWLSRFFAVEMAGGEFGGGGDGTS